MEPKITENTASFEKRLRTYHHDLDVVMEKRLSSLLKKHILKMAPDTH